MNFKTIDQNTDNIINKPYYLCKVNFGELADFIKDKFKGDDVSKFNELYKEGIQEDVKKEILENSDYKDLNTAFKEGYKEHLKWYNDWGKEQGTKEQNFEEWKKSQIKETEDKIKENKKGLRQEEELQNFIFDASTENNFISLYSEEVTNTKSILNLKGKFYLLDGFRRLLYDFNYIKKNRNKEVYVKIYDKRITDQDMMKIVFHFNLWKFPQGIETWMDRGWRFFIYNRLNITLIQEKEERLSDHFTLLDNYLGYGNYSDSNYITKYKLLTSEKFYDDLRLIDEIVHKETLIHDTSKERWHRKDGEFAVEIFEFLGKERLKDNFKDLKFEDIDKFFKLTANEINRIKTMCVRGHYEKLIRRSITHLFEVWSDEKRLNKMRGMDVAKVKIINVPIEDFIKSLPKEIIKKYKIKKRYETRIEIKGSSYIYQKNKIYTGVSGVVENYKPRVYLFFDDYFVCKYDKNYYIINGVTGKLMYSYYSEHENNLIYKGNLLGCLIKLKKMIGKEIKLDAKETKFNVGKNKRDKADTKR